MNYAKHIFYLLLPLMTVLSASRLEAQGCNPNFTYSIGTNGSVTFFNTSTPSLTAVNYTLNYGASYIPNFIGNNFSFTNTTVTYTNIGSYVVTLVMTNTAPVCSQTFTALITVPSCSINFNTSAATGSLCSGSATASAIGFCGPVTYTWSNANIGATQFSLCQGVYTVIASGSNPSCCPTASGVVSIVTNSVCALIANFQHTVLPNGKVNFASTSSGTTATTQYRWSFGDNTSSVTVQPIVSHTYASVGSYSAYLIAVNNSITCLDTSNIQFVQPSICNITATIVTNYTQSGALNFNCLSSGTSTTATYLWDFGDGSFGSGVTTTHSYSTTLGFSVKVSITNNTIPSCADSTTTFVNGNCNLNTAIAHTVGTSGLVNFSSQSVGTNSNSTYLWDFGDGYGDITPNPIHQYINGGTHYVKLRINNNFNPSCKDSVIQAINITGISCNAYANFSLSPSGTPQYWIATPQYPYNVSNAQWSWGDGSFSNTMYASHTYSTAGNYSICLSVTVSCNNTASYCYSQYISKPSGAGAAGLVYINVMAPKLALGVNELKQGEKTARVYPNPSQGDLTIELPIESNTLKIKIIDLAGRIVMEEAAAGQATMHLRTNLNTGLYMLRIESETGMQTIKLLIQE